MLATSYMSPAVRRHCSYTVRWHCTPARQTCRGGGSQPPPLQVWRAWRPAPPLTDRLSTPLTDLLLVLLGPSHSGLSPAHLGVIDGWRPVVCYIDCNGWGCQPGCLYEYDWQGWFAAGGGGYADTAHLVQTNCLNPLNPKVNTFPHFICICIAFTMCFNLFYNNVAYFIMGVNKDI